MIEYYTDRMTPAQHEERARAWAEEVRGLGKWRRSRVMRQIAAREGLPLDRVGGWVRWAERNPIPPCPDCGRPMTRREPWTCANCGEEMDA